jgi:hypothetical protein
MTFSDFKSFVEWLHETDGIHFQETNEELSFATIENVKHTDPCVIAEVLIAAHDSGFTIGAFYCDENARYDGTITFHP